jgi:hypothetical protein
MAYKIQLRRDSATNWTTANTVLSQGEIGLETNTGKIKIGDGSSGWGQIGYFANVSPFLTTANVAEITNLYFTNARVNATVTPMLTTANVIETNANLYFTTTRVNATVQPFLTTANVIETSGNLYFSNTRVLAALYNANLILGNVSTVTVSSTSINNTGNIISSAVSGNLILTSPVSTTSIGYLGIPQNAQTGNYTLTLTDQSKHIYNSGVTGQIITIPLNSSVAFPIGTAVTLVYNSSTGAGYVNTTGGVTLYVAGNTSGSRSNVTIGGYGMATILKIATDTWFIGGAGVR